MNVDWATVIQLPAAFWPASLLGWLTVGGVIAGAIAGVWSVTRVMHHINGYGTRLNDHDARATALDTRMNAAELEVKMAALDRMQLRDAIQRMSTEVQTIGKLVKESHEDKGEIRERLVRIETKLDHRGEQPRGG